MRIRDIPAPSILPDPEPVVEPYRMRCFHVITAVRVGRDRYKPVASYIWTRRPEGPVHMPGTVVVGEVHIGETNILSPR